MCVTCKFYQRNAACITRHVTNFNAYRYVKFDVTLVCATGVQSNKYNLNN
ncbi:hypothetical protein [Urbanus proteus nucleopolyhedrovirus]|uniref:Uncharacterized protein n=1 Tax=Urbanus proteus nucleopolyhedrovirus TaxID=1675866 RepID=A0A161CCZ7_9ABAC|nr:hypothetical protein [Urbanus proteus nucleopolyhedrovirus]AKR17331.1 hypothetical protein [Urbanus proteus nucleopolyhedrovirus]